ncbi:MAG: Ig-like domain-containing protein [Dysgonamonadaceae bacterium]|jgi:uncharacterized protein (TIGR02145 family)|nr:Ig-like domain-containing protein [Dysgonamonadaceae bacterium]
MKKMCFLLFLMVFGIAKVNCQVTIGSDQKPHSGAVLDLQSTKGLKLPNVDISDINVFQLSADYSDAAGMIVYNTNNSTKGGQGTGIYVWDSSKWLPLSYSDSIATPVAPDILVTKITIKASGDAKSLDKGSSLQLTATVEPDNATNKSLKWSISSGTEATVDQMGLVTATATGTITVQAEAQDGSGIKAFYTLTINSSTGPTTVDGNKKKYNAYCYPNNVGCWMIENSIEGTAEMKTYPNKKEGERGYYYQYGQSSMACPAGYVLPTVAQWDALVSYINSANISAEKAHWKNDLAGARISLSLAYWDARAYWWALGNEPSQVGFFNGTLYSSTKTPDYASKLYSVRCIKK